MKMAAYKFNFFTVFLTITAYFSVQLIFMHLVYSNVDSLAGWTRYEMFFYIGTFNIIDSLWTFGPFFNLLAIPGVIRSGALDYYITKPVNSQFLISLRNVDPGSIISALAGVTLITFALIQGGMELTYARAGLYIVSIFHALLIQYSVYFIFTCLAFWLVKADFVDSIHGILCYFSTRPVDIYKGFIRFVLSYVLPYGLALTVASKAAVKTIQFPEYTLFLILSWSIFAVSVGVWRFSLKHYSSASS
ncbi:ABC transporter permease [Paenibacillus ihuae]|uniref:ABC transporter permease n=1 Tax=Paenibacillus ihuae TaxID=1232431 RepID=UPI00131DD26D|nr:ABC-2 family transporter protein [Paenibacillus ihuae]